MLRSSRFLLDDHFMRLKSYHISSIPFYYPVVLHCIDTLHSVCLDPSVIGYLDYFHILGIMNKATLDFFV